MKNIDSKNRSFKIDLDVLREYERIFDPYHPESGTPRIKILGFGEISFVFEFESDTSQNLVYKRLPIFENEEQVSRHINAYNEYNRLLKEDVGINIPPSDAVWVFTDEKKKKGISLYCIQEKMNPVSIGSKVIHNNKLSHQDIRKLVILVVKELKKVWDYNKTNENIQIGLDGQISNFSVIDYDENNPSISDSTKLAYIDTSTPMYRIEGEEAMEPELLLKSAPPLIRGLLKMLFMQEVVDRYYDFRLVLIDLLANFYKEQLPEIVPQLIEDINRLITGDLSHFEIEPLSLKELESYYKGDARIWVIFQTMRRWDRFIRAKIFRRRYNFYLPEKIKR